jgi:hypothetical protein
VKNGFIFLHDTYPPDKSWTIPSKCGTVYKLRQELETWVGVFEVFTFTRSAFDVGLTIVKTLSSRNQRNF